ncbi:MAG: FIST C-terminal domain-containing protein [Burkholderiales bacterium]|nr:FIST C-terminal domain-containing protein [Burkholderiales bacterium]
MTDWQAGHAAHADWRTATLQALAGIERGGSLGFVYVTEAMVPYATEILALAREHTGIADWVGTVGIGICATGTEYFDTPAVALLTGRLPPGAHAVFSGTARPPRRGVRTPSGAEAAHCAIVHADPHTPDIDELIEDMSGKVASGYLAGGLSSSRGPTVQFANQVVSGGISGVMLSAEVRLATRLTQGCAPVGTRHRVTQAEKNIIVTLDGRPALDVMLEALGCDLKGLRQAARNTFVGIVVAGAEAAGGGDDYLVRNLVGIDPQSRLIAIGDTVDPGTTVLFCRRDQASARGDLLRMIYDLKDDLDAPPRAALYHACVGRGESMFGAAGAELGLIREHLGAVPLAGFFANGEIARNRLYGYTGVLTVFA